MNRHICFYDLDSTLWNNKNEIWIIDKNNPRKPVLVLDPIEFALIKKGHYKKDKIILDYNGQRYWISEQLSKKLQKRARTENMERFGISLMPWVDRDLLNKSEIEYLIKNIEHLNRNKFVDIGILTARSNQRTTSDQLNNLRLELKNIGIDIKKIYFVGKSVNTGQNYINKMVILLEHLKGFKIKSGKFISIKQDWYPHVSFYDDDPQNIHYANDIQKIFDEILRKTDDEIFHIIMERLDEVKITLDNYQVTTNETNRFIKSTVELKKPVRFPIKENKNNKIKMKTFEQFINESNESELPTSENSIIRKIWIWQNGSQDEIVNNYNYKEKVEYEPETWNIDTLADGILMNMGEVDEDGLDGMDIGIIPEGSTMVNMYRYEYDGDGKFRLKNKRPMVY